MIYGIYYANKRIGYILRLIYTERKGRTSLYMKVLDWKIGGQDTDTGLIIR